MYNIYENSLDLFTPDKQKVSERVEIDDVNDPRIDNAVGGLMLPNCAKTSNSSRVYIPNLMSTTILKPR